MATDTDGERQLHRGTRNKRYSLVDGIFDALAFTTQTFAFLPAHLLQHLEADVFARDLELLVIGQVRLPTLLQRLQVQ